MSYIQKTSSDFKISLKSKQKSCNWTSKIAAAIINMELAKAANAKVKLLNSSILVMETPEDPSAQPTNDNLKILPPITPSSSKIMTSKLVTYYTRN